ncbi:MAG: potassium channel family protein [Micrococcales bacterium]|nr:potassium channel family protein [Micrococcales bacterium]
MSRTHLARMRPLLGFLGLLLAYFAFPVRWDDPLLSVALGIIVTAAGLGLLGWMLIQELGRYRRGESIRSTESLGMLLVLLVISASLGFFLLNLADPDQILGLRTRTDALYFTLSTMTTVGFGDIHAEGQIGRALVCALIVFDVAVVAALVRALARPPGRKTD